MISFKELQKALNRCGSRKESALFLVDYEMKECHLITSPLQQQKILFDINGVSNYIEQDQINQLQFDFDKTPIDYSEYEQMYRCAYEGLLQGDSFLLNLTVRTPIACSLTLKDIFNYSKAKYRVYMPDRFVCFSPERFITIKEGKLHSYPMKGTIDANIPNAESIILADYKETCEHHTIVDLIRNDLNRVGEHTRVERFRYIDRIDTQKGAILQVSSEVVTELPKDYLDHLGDILGELLPAGSICGAPKPSTLSIIKRAEKRDRGFYTGIVGYFDGERLDCGVLIRYIEQQGDQLFFHSGGGVTINSDCRQEYEEVIEKVYLPIK